VMSGQSEASNSLFVLGSVAVAGSLVGFAAAYFMLDRKPKDGPWDTEMDLGLLSEGDEEFDEDDDDLEEDDDPAVEKYKMVPYETSHKLYTKCCRFFVSEMI